MKIITNSRSSNSHIEITYLSWEFSSYLFIWFCSE